MATLLAMTMLTMTANDENPLLPRYPFQSLKVTYKKAAGKVRGEMLEFEAVAYVKGAKVYCKTRILSEGKLREENVSFTDGTYIYRTETEKGAGGIRKSSNRRRHYGAYLRADYGELSPAERKKFDAGREDVWRRYSPVFGCDWVEGNAKVSTEGTAQVCGRECEIVSVDMGVQKVKYYRWKGTDIMLKMEASGLVLEAEKVEENVEVPDDLFEKPEDAVEDSTEDQFDRATVGKMFQKLTGREAEWLDPEAVPAKVSGLRFGGKDVPLTKFRFQSFGKGDFSEESGALQITAEQGSWRFDLVVPIMADKPEQFAGKTVVLEGDEAGSISDGEVTYSPKKVTVKVISVGPRAVVVRLSGSWQRYWSEGDEDKSADAGAPEIEIRAVAP